MTVHVVSAYVGKSPARPGDNGKRWAAWCSVCKWQQRFPWKGGHRLAVAAAQGHQCPEAPPPPPASAQR